MADDLYTVLGLEPRASHEQIERAYRFCLGLYGEGSLGTYSLLEPSEAEAQRLRVREAYEVLIDPEKRRRYDEGEGFQPPDAEVLPPRANALGGEQKVGLPEKLSGAQLRKMREARGMSLRQIATVTKIGMRYLEYIEEDRFEALPPTVYLKGFLQEYAKLLGLDPRAVATAYMSRLP
jgi:flagellar biosynthesis protein FlhG